MLSMAMGLSWVLEIISWILRASDWTWIAFDLFNASQGIVIFYIYVWKNPSEIHRFLLIQVSADFPIPNSTISSQPPTEVPSALQGCALKWVGIGRGMATRNGRAPKLINFDPRIRSRTTLYEEGKVVLMSEGT